MDSVTRKLPVKLKLLEKSLILVFTAGISLLFSKNLVTFLLVKDKINYSTSLDQLIGT